MIYEPFPALMATLQPFIAFLLEYGLPKPEGNPSLKCRHPLFI